MFKGLAGLKKVVKGGISAVAEHSSDLAEKVISDPSTSQGHLKENLKKKVQDVVASGEQISTETHAKEKADEVAKVVNKVRHYGALGEDYLGYDDPTKDLRKAVKAKEKAAKKARKAKKKKTGKKEDLFDPENLAKFKAELEERKRREAEFLQEQEEEAAVESAVGAVAKESGDEHSQNPSDHEETEVKFTLDLAPGSEQSSRGHSAAPTPKLKSPLTPIRAKEDTDDWKLFQSLTSGVDAVIKKKKEELEDIKQVSYFQKKAQPADDHSDDSPTQGQPKDGKKKKKWVDLDKAGFDDIDGSISGTDDEDASAHEGPVKDAPEAEDKGEEDSEEDKEEDIGLVEIPDDEPLSDEEDIFNTGFVDAITSGEVKLAVIPDDPVYDDKDDPFNTNYADEIVQKDKVEKRKEANRIKFTGLSSVADVLSGKADKVDKSLIEHSTKRKRRRANRINLIGGENTELTAIEDIGFIDPNKPETSQQDILTDVNECSDPPAKKDLLESTSSPLPPSPAALCSDEQKDTPLIDVSEFEVLKDEKEVQLTSNVAILAGEFSAPVQEEEDDFDAAFDALAQESVTRGKLEDLERQFEDTDVFDTTCADTVLNLASLTNKVEEIEEPLETFEDKDPFDTSAYEDITGDLEADLDFDTLAKRDPDQDFKTTKKADIDDEFKGWSEVQPAEDQGWSAFQETEKKPSRPPPPRPAPPRPSRAPAPSKVHLHPLSAKDAPSVVIKAPSTESIKSWNCTTADILIKKSEIEALNDPSLEEEEEEEDPFDTSNFNEIVDKDNDEEDIEDPFDTSGFKSPEPEPESEAEEEAVPDPKPREEPDLLGGNNEGDEDIPIAPITPAAAAEADPFDTEFASGVLPDKGDPFDTSYVKGGPGKAEIKALEEEFLTQEEFDPRTEEGGGTQTSSRKVYPGLAGRARPKRGQQSELQQVKAPTPEEEEEDPFDTTIVDKVIPVRQATKNSEISVEDENFDPTSTFDNCKEEVDPFDTTIASQVIPELAGEEKAKEEPSTPPPPEVEEVKEEVEEVPQEPEPPKPDESYKAFAAKDKPVDEIAKKIGRARPRKPLARQLTDEEFDPRA